MSRSAPTGSIITDYSLSGGSCETLDAVAQAKILLALDRFPTFSSIKRLFPTGKIMSVLFVKDTAGPGSPINTQSDYTRETKPVRRLPPSPPGFQ